MLTIEIIKFLPVILLIIFFSLFVVFYLSYLCHYYLVTERAFILSVYKQSDFEGFFSAVCNDLQVENRIVYTKNSWSKEFENENPFQKLFYIKNLEFEFDYVFVRYDYSAWSLLKRIRRPNDVQ